MSMLHNRYFKTLTYFVTIIFFMAGPVQSYSASRIIPTQKVEVYSGGTLKQVLQEEAPLPMGQVMQSSGRTGLRMNNVYMVAEDGCKLSVIEDSKTAMVKIEKGILFFAATQATGQLVFDTPSGIITTEQIMLKVSNQAMLKAFVDVSDTGTTIGVMEGGALTLATPIGIKTVEEGNQIVLAANGVTGDGQEGAQVMMGDELAEDDDDDKIPAAYFAAGGAALLGLGALMFGLGGGDDSPAPSSPVTP